MNKAVEAITSNKADIQVGVVGLAANIAGNSVGGPLGGLAAEFAASLITRRAGQDVEAYRKAKSSLRNTERFEKAKAIEKARMLLQESRKELAKNRRERKRDMIGEAVGFTLGNSVATLPVPIPLKGGVTALATMPSIMRTLDPYIT